MADKIEVKVFPDHCSSGVWVDHCNADPDELGISPGLQIALKYWHEIWEFEIADIEEASAMTPSVSDSYVQRWKEDGRKLCELLTAETDKYKFVACLGK